MKAIPSAAREPSPQFSSWEEESNGLPPSGIEKRKSKIWIWCVAACVFQLVVWTAWIVVASKHPVPEVPLATAER